MSDFFTTADTARLFCIETWRVRRLYEDGTLPEPPRLGLQRVIAREQIPAIASALKDRGWLKDQPTDQVEVVSQ